MKHKQQLYHPVGSDEPPKHEQIEKYGKPVKRVVAAPDGKETVVIVREYGEARNV